MVNVFLNNGREFQEVSISSAETAQVVAENAPEYAGAPVLICRDRQNHEVARFKWSDVVGYAIGYGLAA